MLFSKSFGYALRGLLYVAACQEEERKIQVDEIATTLQVPRFFMGKILKGLAKQEFLISQKGPYGGFTLHPKALQASLYELVQVTDGLAGFQNCVLRLKECNEANPCPLHSKVLDIKGEMIQMLKGTQVHTLLGADKELFVKSLGTDNLENIINQKIN